MQKDQETSANWQPPAGFQPVESVVPGITIYAPVSEQPPEAVEAPVSFKCPNCGASTRYNVAAGGVTCEYCGYSAPAKSDQVGRRAEEFEFTLETLSQAEQGWGIERRELHCDSCGASLSIPEGALAVTCPFCASNRVNVRVAQAEILRPRFLVPFKIQQDQVRLRAKEWLGRGWMHPPELSQAAVLDRFTGIYLPFWTFDAQVTADWRAEVGHPETERYYDAGSKSWKSRTVIRWRWEQGRVGVNVDDLLVTGSSQLSRRILGELYPFDLQALVAYAPDYLAGWQAQAYDITLPDAWETGKAIIRERGKDACYEDINSSHVRNFSMTADLADESWRYLLLPVYVAAYRFEDKTYQVMMNGQTGEVAGQKPVAWWKIWLAIALLLLPGAGLGLISLPLILVAGFGVVTLMIALILLVIGGAISIAIYRKAVQSEAP